MNNSDSQYVFVLSKFFIQQRTHKCSVENNINPLQTNRRLLYLKAQSVPRCKHFSSRL